MSKINILGIVNSIKSKSNVYTPIVEAVVNSIEAIGNKPDGKIEIIVHRDMMFNFDDSKPYIKSIQIIDNGAGFNITNRESFDTYLSSTKQGTGGKGFGRFMYLKYFHDAIINSQYIDEGKYKIRNFRFGKRFQRSCSKKSESRFWCDWDTCYTWLFNFSVFISFK